MEAEEVAKRRSEFDNRWSGVQANWTKLSQSEVLDDFTTWRDKLIPHADLYHENGVYGLLDLASLGLKWGDLERCVDELQEIVQSINLLTRSSAFDFDGLANQHSAAAREFWSVVKADLSGGAA